MYKVLLVDDEPYVIEGLKTMIDWGKYGYLICGEATNGEDGLQMIRDFDPDLVVTDIRMPVFDGLQLIQQTREQGNSKVQFIILSGYDDFSYIQYAMKYGITDYLLKPIDDQEITGVLNRLSASRLKRASKGKAPGSRAPLDKEASEGGAGKKASLKGDRHKRNQEPETLSRYLEALFCHTPLDGLLEDIKNNNSPGILAKIDILFQDFTRLHSKPEVIKAYLRNLLLEVIKHSLRLNGDIGAILNQMLKFDEKLDGGPAPTIGALRTDLGELCVYMARYLSALSDNNYKDIISAVKNYVKENYAKDINLQKLAKHFYMNPVYLGQLFKRCEGRQFSEYLHQTRIDEAKKLLRRTNMKISEIAYAIGYHDPEYFVSKFKSITQVPPSAFKKS